MMKNRKIKINMDRRVNLGNYESLKVEVGLEAKISDSKNIDIEYDNIADIVSERLFNEIENEMKQMKEIKENEEDE
jgi:hypothetical protein